MIFLDQGDNYTTVHYRPDNHYQTEGLRAKHGKAVIVLTLEEAQLLKASGPMCAYCLQIEADEESGSAL